MQLNNYLTAKYILTYALVLILVMLFYFDPLARDNRLKFTILLANQHTCSSSEGQPVIFTSRDYAGYLSASLSGTEFAHNQSYVLPARDWRTDFPSKFWTDALPAIHSNTVVSGATVTSSAMIKLNQTMKAWLNGCMAKDKTPS